MSSRKGSDTSILIVINTLKLCVHFILDHLQAIFIDFVSFDTLLSKADKTEYPIFKMRKLNLGAKS